jgi:heat shock protein HspQ
MSALSISNHLIMRMLQRQNTKRVIAKKMERGEVIRETDNVSMDVIIDVPNDNANTPDIIKDSVTEAIQATQASQASHVTNNITA